MKEFIILFGNVNLFVINKDVSVLYLDIFRYCFCLVLERDISIEIKLGFIIYF